MDTKFFNTDLGQIFYTSWVKEIFNFDCGFVISDPENPQGTSFDEKLNDKKFLPEKHKQSFYFNYS